MELELTTKKDGKKMEKDGKRKRCTLNCKI